MTNYYNDTNDTKINLFEKKLSTYIDIYNIKYTNISENGESNESTVSTDKIIKYNNIKLERIGNIETIYKKFYNVNKNLAQKLSYSIHKKNTLIVIDNLKYIINSKGYNFNFISYNYELFKVIDIDNMYVIQQKNKNLIYKFDSSCIMLIFIRDKLYIHYY